MSRFLVSTTQLPTAVSCCAVGNFTGPGARNLIVARESLISIFTVTESDALPSHEFTVFGRVTYLQCVNVKGMDTCLLLLVIDTFEIAFLCFVNGKILTRSRYTPNFVNNCRRDGELKIRVFQQQSLIAFIGYNYILEVVLYKSNGAFHSPTRFTIHDPNVYDIALSVAESVLFVLCARDSFPISYLIRVALPSSMRLVSPMAPTLDSTLGEEEEEQITEFKGRQFVQIFLLTSEHLVFLDNTGLTLYSDGQLIQTVSVRASCFCQQLENDQFILQNVDGDLFIVHMRKPIAPPFLLKRVPALSCMCQISPGVFFMGSRVQDSVISTLDAEKNDFAVSPFLTNFGPILDVKLITQSNIQKSLLICCNFKDGYIRQFFYGVNYSTICNLPAPGVINLFSVSCNSLYLFLSFITETRVLRRNHDTVEEYIFPGLITDIHSVLICKMGPTILVQVTTSCILLLDEDKGVLHAVPVADRITNASNIGSTVYTSDVKGNVIMYGIDRNNLLVVSVVPFNGDISSLAESEDYLAVSTWNKYEIQILCRSDLRIVTSIPAPTLVRSMWFYQMDSYLFLVAGLGNGEILYVQLHDGTTGAHGPVTLFTVGNTPVTMTHILLDGRSAIFLSCNIPTIMSFDRNKFTFSPLTINEIVSVVSFQLLDEFHNPMVVATRTELLIIAIDSKRKLPYKEFRIGSQIRRIAYDEFNRYYIISVDHLFDCVLNRSAEILLYSEQGSLISSVTLKSIEGVLSLNYFFQDGQSYILAGTGFVNEDEPCRSGRLMLLSIRDKTLSCDLEKTLNGAVHCIEKKESTLFVSATDKILIFTLRIQAQMCDLIPVFSLEHNVAISSIALNGDYLVVSDLLKSVSVYRYNNNKLTLTCKDLSSMRSVSSQITSVSPLTVITTNGSGGLLALSRYNETKEEGVMYFSPDSFFQYSSPISKIIPGALMTKPGSPYYTDQSYIFTCRSGAIGSLVVLTESQYQFLRSIQIAASSTLEAIGGFSYSAFAQFRVRNSRYQQEGFIDGDLIRKLRDLNQDELQIVLDTVNREERQVKHHMSLDELYKVINAITSI